MDEQSISVRNFCLGCGDEIEITEARMVHRCKACSKRYWSKSVMKDGNPITIDQLCNRVGLIAGNRRGTR